MRPSSRATIATYDRLAHEYDDPGHTTTRALEQLSNEAYRRANPLARSGTTSPVLLELGAGTGALTREILAERGRGRFIVADPSATMNTKLRTRIASFEDIELHRCTAVDALISYGQQTDVVLAGLADPFMTPAMLQAARSSMRSSGVLFVTVPSKRWATIEREDRLGISVDRTRFRLHDGTQLEAASWTYDQLELCALVLDAGFTLIDSDMQTGERRVHDLHPEVTWVLARATRLTRRIA